MFAPVGFTPLAMLWDQFLEAKIDAVYRSSARYYASDEFAPQFLRGSALDIAEHTFFALMWKCQLHAATSDGNIMRVHTRFQDGVPGLFSQISPYRSSFDAAATQLECGHCDEIDRVAGPLFTTWDFEPDDNEVWRERYPLEVNSDGKVSGDYLRRLNFHTLPICFERGRFMIVETLPHWARHVLKNCDQQVLVENLGGRAIVVPDEKLEGWDKILNGETPVLDDEFNRTDGDQARVGRPPKIQKVAEAYLHLHPDGHSCSWKELANRIESELGEPVSIATIRRALNLNTEE